MNPPDSAADVPAPALPPSPFHGARLCIVGNINRDIKTAPFPAGEFLFADGETTVAGVEETIGGGGAISAAAAAALGAQSEFVGQVGDDLLGARLDDALRRVGVRPHLHRARGLATGTTVNLVYDSGHRHFLSCHPNNRELRWESLDLMTLTRVDHLYRADLWFSESMLFEGNRRLFEAARSSGVATSIDLNWDPAWGTASAERIEERKSAVRAVLPLVDLVHGNVRELGEFTNVGPDAPGLAVDRLLQAGAGAVVLHMGAAGAGYFSRTEAFVEPPAPVESPIRSTGTGDVLSVCMMLLHRHTEIPTPDKLRLANQIVADYMAGRRDLIPRLE